MVRDKKSDAEQVDEDFAIDKYNLDEAWVGQPDTYRRYAEALADAKQDFELTKNKLRLARADVEVRIRADPELSSLHFRCAEDPSGTPPIQIHALRDKRRSERLRGCGHEGRERHEWSPEGYGLRPAGRPSSRR